METGNGLAKGAVEEPGRVLEEEARWRQAWGEQDAFAPRLAGEDAVLVVAGGGSPGGESLTLSEARQYIVADFHARFQRMRGADVLFSLGLGPSAESGNGGAGDAAGRREQLESLGLSIDWKRSFERSDPDARRWAGQAFQRLREAGLVTRAEAPSRWCGRCRTALPGEVAEGEKCPVCGEPLRQLAAGSWFLTLDTTSEPPPASMTRAARAMAPVDLFGRTQGWELDVVTTNGAPLALFAEDPKKLEEARFVGISPRHPALEQLIEDPALKERIQAMLSGRARPGAAITDTGIWVHVAPLPDPLPLVVTLTADARFGVTAYLGVPAANPQDAATAEKLPPPPSLRWSVNVKPSKPRPAERLKLNRLPLSAAEAPDGPALSIPLAGGDDPAQGEVVRLDPIAATWMETLVAVPTAERAAAEPGHPEIQRWAAEIHTFHEAAGADALLGDLALIEALGADREGERGGDGNAPAVDLIAGPIGEATPAPPEQADLQQLAQRFGADALRFAILHGSAPTKRLDRAELEAALAPAARFLERLRSYAEPRLAPAGEEAGEAPDSEDPLRSRLRKWCRMALWKVTENEERLDAHRATRNVRILLERIEGFEEQAVLERGELTAEDRRAVREALCLLIGLLAPIAPYLAEALWEKSGNAGLASQAPWPQALGAVAG
jgi:leucyl-tRNA synthetase